MNEQITIPGVFEALVQEAFDIYRQGVALATEGGRTLTASVVLFSGGNDSTTVAHLFRGIATHAGHCNTGIGIEATREYVRRTCTDWGLPLIEKGADLLRVSQKGLDLRTSWLGILVPSPVGGVTAVPYFVAWVGWMASERWFGCVARTIRLARSPRPRTACQHGRTAQSRSPPTSADACSTLEGSRLMRRRNPKGRVVAEPALERPTSLLGAYMLAVVSSHAPDRSRLGQLVMKRYPHGAVDQVVVGRMVFERLARDLFVSHPSESQMVDEFGTGLVRIMGTDTSLSAADVVAAIRAALQGAPPPALTDPLDYLTLYCGFAVAAIGQLELTPAQIAQIFAEAEREAADHGIWLVPVDEQTGELDAARSARSGGPSAAEASGPWDVTDLPDPRVGRIDFGSLLLRLPKGSHVSLEQSNDEFVAITVNQVRTTMTIQAFAAPTGGMWETVRRELAESFARRGGTTREVARLGVELWAQVVDSRTANPKTPGADAENSYGISHMRFFGKDGPGWFCRAVLQWRGVPDPAEFTLMEGVFQDTVVVRGGAVLADRARLPLVAP